MQRYVKFEVTNSSWPTGTAPASVGALAGRRKVNMLDMTLNVALYTAPPLGYGFELSYFWAALRYLPAIDSTRNLRLRAEWSDLDPHQKTILSDDFGAGFGTTVLEMAYNSVAIVPTTYFLALLDRRGINPFMLGKVSKNGAAKSPDYMAVRPGYATVDIVECKGTQTPGHLQKAMKTGEDQKNNLQTRRGASGWLGDRLVVGVYVSTSAATGHSACVIKDPTPPRVSRNLAPDLIKEIALRIEYARAASMMGLTATAASMLADEYLSDDAQREIDTRRSTMRPRDTASVPAEEVSVIRDLPRPLSRGETDEEVEANTWDEGIAPVLRPITPDDVVAFEASVGLPSTLLDSLGRGGSIASIVTEEGSRPRERRRTEGRIRELQTPTGVVLSLRPLRRSERESR